MKQSVEGFQKQWGWPKGPWENGIQGCTVLDAPARRRDVLGPWLPRGLDAGMHLCFCRDNLFASAPRIRR